MPACSCGALQGKAAGRSARFTRNRSTAVAHEPSGEKPAKKPRGKKTRTKGGWACVPQGNPDDRPVRSPRGCGRRRGRLRLPVARERQLALVSRREKKPRGGELMLRRLE